MKIAIIGFSGCGKSTLARDLGERFGAEVLHIDSIHFLPGWIERDVADEQRIMEEFLNSHDAWVIDGNYGKLSYGRRMDEADHIIMMLFGRFTCFRRVVGRYRRFKNKTRPDIAEGCTEKLDKEFITWVLWRGRSRGRRRIYKDLAEKYSGKVTVLKNQRQLDEFRKGIADGSCFR